jgi:glutaredoxin 3
MATKKRKIEIFTAGCNVCRTAVEQVRKEACASCDIVVLEMSKPEVERRAQDLGIASLPAVVIDGKVADCCSNRGINLDVLRKAGLGRPLA